MAEAEKRRLFFGLWPDPDTRAGLVRLAAELGPEGGRPVHPEDLHLTLAFLGQIAAPRLDCVLAAAGRVRGEPFELQVDRVGFFARPRILWCGPAEHPPELLRLAAGLREELQACGIKAERRPFQAHVTLVRKAPKPTVLRVHEAVRWPVRELVLAGSVPGDRPPRYRVSHRWPLGG